ncbi:ArsR/SmtB family transcription factor [Salisediminibacterium beveridgei]|uniref:Transcriptional regulator, ArsR family n=1 Tax=Salisediminibacterium beveridgei TaxID=632773 RepID=A0A1D7QY28_9BACI|nr:metalloregulator ArsR/SmtB family transcription factor [Salisediminibacterium beveridgei]AOM83912.1 transcriptional regulator, ArsR family [Salisediminibacterium beveridgei]
MNHPDLTSQTAMYKMLSDEKRLHILRFLKVGGLCVCDLEVLLEMSQPAVSQHLRKLKQTGLITSHRHDQWQIYTLNEGYGHYDQLLSILDNLPSAKEQVDEITASGIRSRCSIEITEIRFLEKRK